MSGNNTMILSLRLPFLLFISLSAGFVHAVPLQNGSEITGSLSSPGQTVQYTFQGSAGDSVFISLGDITAPSSSFAPELELYDSGGTLVASDWGGTASSVQITLTNSDQYTALVKDHYTSYIGDYSISYARIPGADEGGTLDNPSVVSTAIDIGDMDTYTMSASAGQTIHLSAGDLAGNSFAPHIYLYDPSGGVVADAWGGSGVSIRYQTLVSGRYTVLIKDHYDAYSGNYDLHYARAPGADELGDLVNDEKISETITLGDVDSYRTVLSIGQVIHIGAGDQSATSFAPHIYLYDSSGALVADDWGGIGASIIYEALENGAYTIVLEDHYSAYSGDYDLYMSRAPGADDGGTLTNGDVLTDSIDLADIDGFSFNCNANASAQLTVEDTSGTSFAPHIYLYDITGDLIADDWSGGVADISNTIPSSGSYTFIVKDHYGSYAGNYRLNAVLIGCNGGSGSPAMCDGRQVTVNIGNGQSPTKGNDVILGTSASDLINAGGGNDVVCAEGGNDTIYGSAGDDMIFGGSGEDTIYAGAGADYVDGGADIDNLYGQGGSDTIEGGGGFDYIVGGSGNDDIVTGDGGATVIAGGNNDVIEGSPDRDVIYGNSGLDTIHGRAGNDELYGGNGADYIFGGTGDDIVNGQGARDNLYGESGDDAIRGGIGNDLLDGGADSDDCDGQGGNDTEINCEI